MRFLFSPVYPYALTFRSSLVGMSVRPFLLRNVNALRSKAETLYVLGVSGPKDDPKGRGKPRTPDPKHTVRSFRLLLDGLSAVKIPRKNRDLIVKSDKGARFTVFATVIIRTLSK